METILHEDFVSLAYPKRSISENIAFLDRYHLCIFVKFHGLMILLHIGPFLARHHYLLQYL